MPRKSKNRKHLGHARMVVERYPNGIISAEPIKKIEWRLANRGKDYRDAKGAGTSRAKRAREKRIAANSTAFFASGHPLVKRMALLSGDN